MGKPAARMYIRYMSSDIFPYLRSVSIANLASGIDSRPDSPATSASTCLSLCCSWSAGDDVTFALNSLSDAE